MKKSRFTLIASGGAWLRRFSMTLLGVVTLTLLLCTESRAWVGQGEQVIVYMANGDRLAGEFISADESEVQIKTTYGGQINISTGEIKEWEAADEQVRSVIAAALPEKDKSLASAASEKGQSAAQNSGNALATKTEQTDASAVWERSFDFAYSLARGNSNMSDLNLAFGVSRKEGPNRMVFTISGRRSERDGTQEADRLNTTFRYERPVMALPAFNEVTYEVDRTQRLKYRLSESAGLSYNLFKSEQSKLNLDVGTGVSRDVYSTGVRQNFATSLFRASAEQKLSEKIKLNQQLTVISNLFRPGNTRFETKASLTLPITGSLAFQMSGLNRYDNHPQGEAKPNDFSLLTGFKFNF
jgi:putative salt-induced outer membrane protein YdiY